MFPKVLSPQRYKPPLLQWKIKVVFEHPGGQKFPNEQLFLGRLLPQFNLEDFRLSEHYKLSV